MQVEKNAQLVAQAFTRVETGLKNINIFHTDHGNEFIKNRVFASLEELKIKVYTPLTSQVPGIPITIKLDKDKGNITNSYTIKLEATKGKLLDWNVETGVVTSRGNTTNCVPGDTLFRSPLVPGKTLIEYANIVIIFEKDGTQTGKQNIHIEMRDDFIYVTLGDLEVSTKNVN